MSKKSQNEVRYTLTPEGACVAKSLSETQDYYEKKSDAGKPQLSLVCYMTTALTAITRVLEFGAEKYARDSWRSVPNAKQRYLDALLRHAISYAAGERVDPESGQPTLAHLACCVMFLLELENSDV